ncbi:hypothetical protein F1559_003286 [Cyanidiococcus yangmingshanensis]|uniref:Uncharacterized protein n=1 Tax=Cyanidiococcus yangmingshanensis TaxID=2690220 RepID=A0A7J7IJX0_9RHOD|nr:hypothetical protein F1559_003286 [Cyanidiococcus yangmingshanensis]
MTIASTYPLDGEGLLDHEGVPGPRQLCVWNHTSAFRAAMISSHAARVLTRRAAAIYKADLVAGDGLANARETPWISEDVPLMLSTTGWILVQFQNAGIPWSSVDGVHIDK